LERASNWEVYLVTEEDWRSYIRASMGSSYVGPK